MTNYQGNAAKQNGLEDGRVAEKPAVASDAETI